MIYRSSFLTFVFWVLFLLRVWPGGFLKPLCAMSALGLLWKIYAAMSPELLRPVRPKRCNALFALSPRLPALGPCHFSPLGGVYMAYVAASRVCAILRACVGVLSMVHVHACIARFCFVFGRSVGWSWCLPFLPNLALSCVPYPCCVNATFVFCSPCCFLLLFLFFVSLVFFCALDDCSLMLLCSYRYLCYVFLCYVLVFLLLRVSLCLFSPYLLFLVFPPFFCLLLRLLVLLLRLLPLLLLSSRSPQHQ